MTARTPQFDFPTDALIAGSWTGASDGQRFEVLNPANGNVLARVADGTVADAETAMHAAHNAQEAWAATSPRERGEILRRAYELVLEHSDQLAELMTLEMGKPLADIDTAVEGAMTAKMRNMGEACTAANRLYVHANIAEEFTRRFAERMDALRVGPGWEEGVQVGPLIDDDGLQKVQELVADAVARGASIATGRTHDDHDGLLYPPTVLADVPREAALATTEIFGPVAPIFTFEDEEEAIRLANDTEWGLVGYVFTKDVDRAFDLSERLAVGMVGLNTGIVSNPLAPFGGIKASGLGREGSTLGIDEYLAVKYVALPRARQR